MSGNLLNFINGQYEPPESGEWQIRGRSPDGATDLAMLPESDSRDVVRAVESARAAQRQWAARSTFERGESLQRLACELGSRADDIAAEMCVEVGKPINEAHAEIENAVKVLKFYGGLGHTLGGEVIPSTRDNVHLYTKAEPRGVVGAITPWNFPINLPIVKLAPALLAGNTAVWKPASAGASTSMKLVECFRAGDIPPGVINLVLGSGAKIGPAFLSPNIDVISFTGSTEVGQDLRSKASRVGIPCLLELGGKNAMVVLADADIEAAATTAVQGAFGYAGQKCTATSRLIADESVADALLARIENLMDSLEVGMPQTSTTNIGPLISGNSVEKTLVEIDDAIGAGARVVAGGDRVTVHGGERGHFLAPALVSDVTPDMMLAQKELFAPVIALMTVNSLDHAIDLVNASTYGLSAAIFTRDLQSAFLFSEGVRVGAVQVNLPTSGLEYQAPLGGRANSGAGGYEGGLAALNTYRHLKTTAISYS